MTTGERIKYLRKTLLGLTQQEFASRINISRSNMGNIETNSVSATDRVILDICKEFRVNEIWLRTGEGDPFLELPEMDDDEAYIESLMMDKDDEFIRAVKALLKVYDRMDDISKKAFKHCAKEWLKEMNKEAD